MWDETPDLEPERSPDPQLKLARRELERIFNENPAEVFYSRQLEIHLEHLFFDWITNRALRELIADREVEAERRDLATGTSILLVWNRKNRYSRRRARRVQELVEAYSSETFGKLVGHHGQIMFESGMARAHFNWVADEVNEWNGRKWTRTNHDLDYIYERDSIFYGVEVKNALGRIDQDELEIKLEMCNELGLVPFFAVRWMPKTWIYRSRMITSASFWS